MDMGSIDETDEIPGNIYVRDKFISNLRSNQAVAFIGAGVSIEIYKSWSALLKFLGREAKKRGMATDDDIDFWTIQELSRPQQVARMIRKKFGEDAEFYKILGEYFSSKNSDTTLTDYTQLHRLVAQLPFRGIVTTNYDPGIWNALLDYRKDACKTPPATWYDADIVRKWVSGDIFRDSVCPVLHLHGSWTHPSTMILDSDRYRVVYNEENFSAMFKGLWQQHSLVIIGYGFSDTWLDRNLDDVLARNPEYEHSRHIALLGLRRKDDKHVPRYREMMQNLYRVNVLFYRIEHSGTGSEDHSDLVKTLEGANQIITSEATRTSSEEALVSGAEEYSIRRLKKEVTLPSFQTINRNFE
jgi:hypothetical protein